MIMFFFRGKWTLEVEFAKGEPQHGFIKVNLGKKQLRRIFKLKRLPISVWIARFFISVSKLSHKIATTIFGALLKKMLEIFRNLSWRSAYFSISEID
jgi:hypothetical protein